MIANLIQPFQELNAKLRGSLISVSLMVKSMRHDVIILRKLTTSLLVFQEVIAPANTYGT